METSNLRKIANDIIKDLNNLENRATTIDKISHGYTATQRSVVIKHLRNIEERIDNQHKDKLLNLLAVIHRDGGHYTEEHGIEKSTQDATLIISNQICVD